MENKNYYYLYQITNLINGKIYIGVHSTNNLDDNYMGSGTAIKLAIKKYGVENFQKEILKIFNTEEEMYKEETEYVTKEFVLRDDVYNIATGGFGDYQFGSFKGSINSINGGISTYTQNKGIFSKNSRNNLKKYLISEENIYKLYKMCIIASSFKVNEKRKKTFKNIKHQQGDKNSQFGKMWITDGINSKKILKKEEIPEGWRKGRIIKKL